MNATIKDNRKALIRKLHTLRGAIGMTQGQYEALLEGYGVESSRDMTELQLEGACRFLQSLANEKRPDADQARKRLLAAACQMLEKTVGGWEGWSEERRLEYAKCVVCRAAGVERYDSRGRDNFNRMPMERMRSLTYAFGKRCKDMDGVVEAVEAALKKD